MSGTFQIHDGTFGLSLYEASDAREALLSYFADRQKAALRTQVAASDDGTAKLTVDGVTYTAYPYSEYADSG
jgi:hypothetical protein